MDKYKDFIVGAYASSPALFNWNKSKEIEFMNKLKEDLNPIRGLELPFWGDSIHQFDEELFLTLLDENWEYVLTCLPGNMKALELNIHFGLASDNYNGRMEAIEFYKKASKTVRKINSYFGCQKIISVAIATSPSLKYKEISSSAGSLENSLEELIRFDWDGAKLVIEHCDSGRKENSVKGFLSIEEEIKVINNINIRYNKNIGMTINWARSVIEYKNTSGAINHIKQANSYNILSGLIFSGTSKYDEEYGVWSDLHMPIAKENGINYYEKNSLLNKKNIEDCLKIINYNKLDYIGIKLLAIPVDDVSLERRIGINKDAICIINNIIKEINE